MGIFSEAFEERIDALEAENKQLKAELSGLRVRHMAAGGELATAKTRIAELGVNQALRLARRHVRQVWKRGLLTDVRIEDDDAQSERIAFLETEVLRLKAELRQYQPSDGMMYKLLGLNDVIREGAALATELDQLLENEGPLLGVQYKFRDWLKHPTVDRAVKSAMAQAKVKP